MHSFLAGWAVEARAFQRELQVRAAGIDGAARHGAGGMPVEPPPDGAREHANPPTFDAPDRSRHVRRRLPFVGLAVLALVVGSFAWNGRAEWAAGSGRPGIGPTADESASHTPSPITDAGSRALLTDRTTPAAGIVHDDELLRVTPSPVPIRRDPCPYVPAPRALSTGPRIQLAGYVLPCPPFGLRRLGGSPSWG